MTVSTGSVHREAEILLYQIEDGRIRVEVRVDGETAWLTQKALAELFGVKVPAINKHLNKTSSSRASSRRIQLLPFWKQLPPTAKPSVLANRARSQMEALFRALQHS